MFEFDFFQKTSTTNTDNNACNYNPNGASFRLNSFNSNNNIKSLINSKTSRSTAANIILNGYTTNQSHSYFVNSQQQQQQQQPNNHHHRYSDLSNLSLVYLKKGLSGSSSFQNKASLYSNNQHLSSDISTDPDPDPESQPSPTTTQTDSMNHHHYHYHHQVSIENLTNRRSLAVGGATGGASAVGVANSGTSLNTANINRFIRPKLAVNASSTSTCNLTNAGSSAAVSAWANSSASSGGVLKPPLPQSKSTISELTVFIFFFFVF